MYFLSWGDILANSYYVESEQTQQAESSTQPSESATQGDIERTGTSGTYVLRYNMKKQYRTKEIITQSADEYKQTGILYIILGLIFLNSQSMTSRKYFFIRAIFFF